jgi:hypothetical protein
VKKKKKRNEMNHLDDDFDRMIQVRKKKKKKKKMIANLVHSSVVVDTCQILKRNHVAMVRVVVEVVVESILVQTDHLLETSLLLESSPHQTITKRISNVDMYTRQAIKKTRI